MDLQQRQRGVYVTARQKKKLVEFMTKNPQLISGRASQDFSYRDSQRMWQTITNELNAMSGARKTWRQWKKTWQDLRSKTKKRQTDSNGVLPNSVVMLSPAEQEALGLKNVLSTTTLQQRTEFVPLEEHNDQDNFDNTLESSASYSDADSSPEQKVFIIQPEEKLKKLKNNTKQSSNHANTCVFNCEMLAVQEQRKIQIKEDYLNFKKDYLRQKLVLMKEQTEALRSIAKELSVNK